MNNCPASSSSSSSLSDYFWLFNRTIFCTAGAILAGGGVLTLYNYVDKASSSKSIIPHHNQPMRELFFCNKLSQFYQDLRYLDSNKDEMKVNEDKRSSERVFHYLMKLSSVKYSLFTNLRIVEWLLSYIDIRHMQISKNSTLENKDEEILEKCWRYLSRENLALQPQFYGPGGRHNSLSDIPYQTSAEIKRRRDLVLLNIATRLKQRDRLFTIFNRIYKDYTENDNSDVDIELENDQAMLDNSASVTSEQFLNGHLGSNNPNRSGHLGEQQATTRNNQFSTLFYISPVLGRWNTFYHLCLANKIDLSIEHSTAQQQSNHPDFSVLFELMKQRSLKLSNSAVNVVNWRESFITAIATRCDKVETIYPQQFNQEKINQLYKQTQTEENDELISLSTALCLHRIGAIIQFKSIWSANPLTITCIMNDDDSSFSGFGYRIINDSSAIRVEHRETFSLQRVEADDAEHNNFATWRGSCIITQQTLTSCLNDSQLLNHDNFGDPNDSYVAHFTRSELTSPPFLTLNFFVSLRISNSSKQHNE
jgi:hypothetical protein